MQMKLPAGKKYFYLTKLQEGLDNSTEQVLSKNKWDEVKQLASSLNIRIEKILYIGNDLNDFEAMINCGMSVCPADSHIRIRNISKIVLKSNGGDGVVRELLEDVLGIDILELLYTS